MKMKINRKEHAIFIEKKIISKLRGTGMITNFFEYYDIEINGLKIEVKSVEIKHITSYQYRKKAEKGESKYLIFRPATYKINIENHKQLLNINGYYCFVLTLKNTPIIIRFCKARDIENIFNNNLYCYRKHISSKSKIRYLIALMIMYCDFMLTLNEFTKYLKQKKK